MISFSSARPSPTRYNIMEGFDMGENINNFERGTFCVMPHGGVGRRAEL